MPQWIFETAAGSFWIALGQGGLYMLGLGERILGAFPSPQDAARLLARRKAGASTGGRRRSPPVNVPSDLSYWRFSPT